jgi:predicted O-methyltransferase YrrM
MPDFAQIKRTANGMLAPEVYRAIYETASAVQSGNALEVGTAHGAGTICMALGLETAGNPGRVITIDKIEGGSRDAFGSVEDNIKIIESNFARFGVADRIDLHVGSAGEIASQLPQDLRLGLLMLDADGAIDRDFALFYNSLLPGAPIIIDDYKPDFVRLYRNGRRVRTDQKRRLTALLVDYFEGQGLLERSQLINETWFGRKPAGVAQDITFDFQGIACIYRNLTFVEGMLHNPISELAAILIRRFPTLHAALKKAYLAQAKLHQ